MRGSKVIPEKLGTEGGRSGLSVRLGLERKQPSLSWSPISEIESKAHQQIS